MTQAAGVVGTARTPGCQAGRLGWASRAGQSSWAQVGRGALGKGCARAGNGGRMPHGHGEKWGLGGWRADRGSPSPARREAQPRPPEGVRDGEAGSSSAATRAQRFLGDWEASLAMLRPGVWEETPAPSQHRCRPTAQHRSEEVVTGLPPWEVIRETEADPRHSPAPQ